MSEKRQRTQVVAARVRPDEKAVIEDAALAASIAVGAFVRAAAMTCALLLVGDSDVREDSDEDQ